LNAGEAATNPDNTDRGSVETRAEELTYLPPSPEGSRKAFPPPNRTRWQRPIVTRGDVEFENHQWARQDSNPSVLTALGEGSSAHMSLSCSIRGWFGEG
jgi:hypothetical protein